MRGFARRLNAYFNPQWAKHGLDSHVQRHSPVLSGCDRRICTAWWWDELPTRPTVIDSYLTIANSPLLWVFLIMVVAAFGIMKVTTLEVKPKHFEAGWLRKNYIGLVIAVAAIVALSAIYFYLFGIGVSLSGLVARLRTAAIDKDTNAEDIRNLGTTVALLMGVLAAAATIIFSIIRIWINERTATATEEGLITDRISKAVEGLGAEKTVKDQDGESTKPNLEVRIGAIYALERIAQDSLRDHIQIMEILCAYIRENAPLRETEKNPFEIWQDTVSDDPNADKPKMPGWEEIVDWANTLPKPRTDIQVALEVIGRRAPRQIKVERDATVRGSKVGYRLDLRSTCLQGADLSELEFTHCLFNQAQLQGADLNEAQLQGARLSKAQLQGAVLFEAQLQGAHLSEAQLQGADLEGAQLQGAYLFGAQLQRADLNRAQLQGAYLIGAQSQGADLRGAQLQGAQLGAVQFDSSTFFNAATLEGAALKNVDFTHATISSEQIKDMFGDATVTLPDGHGPGHQNWPDHWSKEKLDMKDFFLKWHAFQARIGQDPDYPT